MPLPRSWLPYCMSSTRHLRARFLPRTNRMRFIHLLIWHGVQSRFPIRGLGLVVFQCEQTVLNWVVWKKSDLSVTGRRPLTTSGYVGRAVFPEKTAALV